MKERTKKCLLICIAIIIILLITTILLIFNNEDDEKLKVRVAYFPNITHTQALVMKAQGTLEETYGDDIDVKWQCFNSGSAEVLSLFAGDIDIGYIGPGPAINAYSKSDGDFVIISGASNNGAVLIAQNDIDSIADLSGKTIAVPGIGNTQHLCLLKLLRDKNLKTTDNGGTVNIVQSSNSDILTLMANGEVDAALVPEPWGSIIETQTNAKILVDYDEIWEGGEYPVAVVVVAKDFLNEHPDLVEEFLNVHYNTTDFINENLDKAIELVSDEIEKATQKVYDREILESAFSRMIITNDVDYNTLKIFSQLSIEQLIIREIPDKDLVYSMNEKNNKE